MIDTPAIEELLGELEALRAVATKGTWSWEDSPPTAYAGRVDPVGEFGGWSICGHGYNLFGRLHEISHNGRADLDLAVGAVNSLPTLITTIRALMEAVEEKVTGSDLNGWQPIDTAPKDGAKFDAWVPDAFGGHRMCNLSFNWRGRLRQNGLLSDAELPRWPTHWMPLPQPPAIRSKGDA